MPCNAGTYTVSTANTPSWDGTLVIDGSGNGQFTPSGNGAPGSGSVSPHCGSDNGGAFLDFTNNNVTPAVHYKKAYWNGSSYAGDCDNDSAKQTQDTWTATPSQIPGGEHKQHY